MRMQRTILKGVVRLTVTAVLLMVLLAVCGWWFFQTGRLTRLSARIVGDAMMNEYGWTVQWGGLHGSLLSTWTCDQVTISDRDGPWLEIKELGLAWNWKSLKHGCLKIDRVQAAYIRMLRIPSCSDARYDRENKPWSGVFPSWPLRLREINLGYVGVERLYLSRDAVGLDSLFRADAAVCLVKDESAMVHATVERLDGLSDHALFDFQLTNRLSQGTISLDVQESSGSLSYEWFGSEYSPIRIQLHGGGRINQWTGRAFFALGSGTRGMEWSAAYGFSDKDRFSLLWHLHTPLLPAKIYGQVLVTGPLNAPELDATWSADAIDMAALIQAPVDPLYASAWLCVKNGILQGTLISTGLTHCAVNADITVPVSFSLNPFVFKARRQEKVSGRSTVDLDVQFLAPVLMTFQQSIRGILLGDIQMGGTLDEPELSGGLRMTAGRYEHYEWGTQLHQMNLNAELLADRLVIRKAEAQDNDGGMLSLTGTVSFAEKEKSPLDLRLMLDRLLLVNQPRQNLQASADVHITGNASQVMAEGTSTVNRAVVSIEQSLPPETYDMDVIEVNRPGTLQEQRRKRQERDRTFGLNMALNAPGRIFINGRGLASEWKAAIRATGPLKTPQVTGELSLVQGTLIFLGKRLNLTQCSIAFNGSWPLIPQVDIRAYATTPELTAYMRIYGPASNPHVEISSDPVRPQNEILAMLLFSKTTDQLTAGEALKMAYGIQILRGEAPGDGWLSRVQNFLGLDQVGLKQGDQDQTQLAIGRYFGEYLYVEGEKSLKGDGDMLTLEVRLTSELQLQATAGNEEGAGQSLYLHWRKDY